MRWSQVRKKSKDPLIFAKLRFYFLCVHSEILEAADRILHDLFSRKSHRAYSHFQMNRHKCVDCFAITCSVGRKQCCILFCFDFECERSGCLDPARVLQRLPFKARTITYSSQSKFSEGKWLPGEHSSLASPRAAALRDRRQSRSYQNNCLWKWPQGRAWSKPLTGQ